MQSKVCPTVSRQHASQRRADGYPYLEPSDAGQLTLKVDDQGRLTMTGLLPRGDFLGALREARGDPRHKPELGFMRVIVKVNAKRPRDGQLAALQWQGADRRARRPSLPKPSLGLLPIARLAARTNARGMAYLQGHAFDTHLRRAMEAVGDASFVRVVAYQASGAATASFVLAIGPAGCAVRGEPV